MVTLAIGSRATLDAEETGDAAVATLLGVRAPQSWPPAGNDADTRDWLRGLLAAHPGEGAFVCHYIVADDRLVGTCGFTGPPQADGQVEIGYGVIESEQRKGYATAAVRQLITIAFGDPRVTIILADTLAGATRSQKVLTACGFEPNGQRCDDAGTAIAGFRLIKTAST